VSGECVTLNYLLPTDALQLNNKMYSNVNSRVVLYYNFICTQKVSKFPSRQQIAEDKETNL